MSDEYVLLCPVTVRGQGLRSGVAHGVGLGEVLGGRSDTLACERIGPYLHWYSLARGLAPNPLADMVIPRLFDIPVRGWRGPVAVSMAVGGPLDGRAWHVARWGQGSVGVQRDARAHARSLRAVMPV